MIHGTTSAALPNILKSLGLACLLVFLGAPFSRAAEPGRVVFVLDGSNSMWGRIDGTEKIVVARDVLGGALSQLPSDMPVGVAAYGHRKENSCDDIEMVLPVGTHSQKEFDAAVRTVQPRGMTPTSAALQFVAEQLAETPGPIQVILVSDGKETCNQDPCAAVHALRDNNADLTVHVVGFDVTSEEGEELQCIAEAGGGEYASAETADEMMVALSTISEVVVEEAAMQQTSTPLNRDKTHWRLQAGDNTFEGNIAYISRAADSMAIQLVNLDAVNLGLRLSREGDAARPVDHAFFSESSGPFCELVTSDPPFEVRFDEGEDEWLDGSFSGMLACPNYSALPVSGSFHLSDRGE